MISVVAAIGLSAVAIDDASAARHDSLVYEDSAVLVFANDDPLPMAFESLASAAGLARILRSASERGLIGSDPADPSLVARELLDKQWDSRWPKRPRWLDRRLHGDDAPSI